LEKSEMRDSLHATLTEGMKYTCRFIFGISHGKAGSEVNVQVQMEENN